MTPVYSFPPISDHGARTLILGSMPGVASLAAEQYYAHPRNCFWKIVTELFAADADLSYSARATLLNSQGIALWDVLASCRRPGSLDSAIDEGSIVTNDFVEFFARHPSIDRVFFNGQKAEQSYRRHVLGQLVDDQRRYQRLPSTSPANASMNYQDKLAAWQAIVG